MAFNSALTFPFFSSPHRVSHSVESRISLGNANSCNGCPKFLAWPDNRIAKRMRSVRTFAELDDENNEKNSVKEIDRYAELANITEIMRERIRIAQRMLQVESVRAQRQLLNELYDGFSEGQLVKITVTGLHRPAGVEIAEAAMEVGAEKLALLVFEAQKDAFQKTTESLKNKLRNIDAFMGMPEQALEQGVL